MSGPKYVSVYWEQKKKFTTQKIFCVRNPSQLKNSKLDDVEHQGRDKAAEREGGEIAGNQTVLDSSSAESDSSSSSKCYDNIPSTFFESQLQAKVYGQWSVCFVCRHF